MRRLAVANGPNIFQMLLVNKAISGLTRVFNTLYNNPNLLPSPVTETGMENKRILELLLTVVMSGLNNGIVAMLLTVSQLEDISV